MSVTDKKSQKSDTDDERDVETPRSTFVPVKPFEMIIFGATGDLARRKIFPALYHRFVDGQVPANSRIIGVSRSEHSREEFIDIIHENYCEFEKDDKLDPKSWKKFTDLIEYVSIDVLKDTDWSNLASAVDDKNSLIRVFYLAMPPSMFAGICQGLKKAGLAHKKSRVVLEKPIGTDFDSAHKLMKGSRRFLTKIEFTELIIIWVKRPFKTCSFYVSGIYF